jgi:hypothetical protein
MRSCTRCDGDRRVGRRAAACTVSRRRQWADELTLGLREWPRGAPPSTRSFLQLPLEFLSTAYMQASLMPGWISTVADFNPRRLGDHGGPRGRLDRHRLGDAGQLLQAARDVRRRMPRTRDAGIARPPSAGYSYCQPRQSATSRVATDSSARHRTTHSARLSCHASCGFRGARRPRAATTPSSPTAWLDAQGAGSRSHALQAVCHKIQLPSARLGQRRIGSGIDDRKGACGHRGAGAVMTSSPPIGAG